jgi:hypothetical protein
MTGGFLTGLPPIFWHLKETAGLSGLPAITRIMRRTEKEDWALKRIVRTGLSTGS